MTTSPKGCTLNKAVQLCFSDVFNLSQSRDRMSEEQQCECTEYDRELIIIIPQDRTRKMKKMENLMKIKLFVFKDLEA